MAFDKVKTLRAGEKYLEMGKIAAAIKEYCQIVAVDADDFTTLNMLGDLYTRVGKKSEAVNCFRRIAEHYSEQGFGLKAIAMYKKIDRLQPNDVEIATYLADLYAQQDLIVEARAHYLKIVEAYNRAGATESALEALRKIADLDPQNTNIRTKLADSYLRQGMNADAATCLAEAGHVLVARGSFDEALDVFGRALEINPEDYPSLKGVLAAHSARGTADEAAEAIEAALATKPADGELLALLGTAYIEADDPEEAERVTALLVTHEPAAYLRFMEVARLYLRHDKIGDAVQVVGKISEQMLAEREQDRLFALIEELLGRDADNVQALRLQVRANWWVRDVENLRGALERLAEAAQAVGLDQDERYALTQLTRLEPERQDYLARLEELGGAEEEAAREALPEIDATVDADAMPAAPAEQFAFNAEDVVTGIEETTFDWSPADEFSGNEPAPSETTAETGFSFESIVAQELAGDSAETGDPQNDEDRAASMLRQELESVDFYIAQGYIDIALDTLALLEQQCGNDSQIEARRAQINRVQSGAPADAVETVIVEAGEVVFNDTVHPAQNATFVDVPASAPAAAVSISDSSQVATGIDAGLAEIFEEYRASSEEEGDAAANGDYETHYNLGLAYKEMDLFEDALEEFQIAVSLTSPTERSSRYLQCCNLLGHCFMQTGVPELAVKWFMKALTSANSDDERLALTYEMAAAYEQAGDLDRALESFTEVYGNNVSYRNVSDRVRALKARLGEKSTVTPRATRSEQLVN
jgi:tetratricopeptide (TPR) repeat protein